MFGRFSAKSKKRPVATEAGERVYAIGDIHGRADLLLKLFHKISEDGRARGSISTRIILLGDLIDRGRSSKQVLEMARHFQRMSDAFVVLSGNHEEMLVHSAAGSSVVQKLWFENGGLATLASFGLNREELLSLSARERGELISRALGEELIEWLTDLPLVCRSGDYLFCHAGIRPGLPLDEQKREDLLWIRNDFLDSDADHGAMIIHGHSEGLTVEHMPNRVNIDTAAHRTGLLTAIGLENEDRWFLEAVED